MGRLLDWVSAIFEESFRNVMDKVLDWFISWAVGLLDGADSSFFSFEVDGLRLVDNGDAGGGVSGFSKMVSACNLAADVVLKNEESLFISDFLEDFCEFGLAGISFGDSMTTGSVAGGSFICCCCCRCSSSASDKCRLPLGSMGSMSSFKNDRDLRSFITAEEDLDFSA